MNNNLNFTFYDTISYLVPGLLLLFASNRIFSLEFDINNVNPLVYFVTAYVCGAVLNMLSLFLYRHIETKIKFIEKIARLSKYITIPVRRVEYTRNELITLVKEKYRLDFTKDKLGLYVFADTVTSNSAIADKDVLIAKEGFFRNLTVAILVVSCLTFKELGSHVTFLLGGLLLFELCYYGREHYKELKNQKIYMLAYFKINENKTI